MLVKPWTFVGKKKGKKGFPYLAKLRLKDTGTKYLGEPVFAPSGKLRPHAVQYPQSGEPPAQGSVRLPKGLFLASPGLSDHAIVFVPLDGRLYDPSYGSGPFATVADWIRRRSRASRARMAPPVRHRARRRISRPGRSASVASAPARCLREGSASRHEPRHGVVAP